VCRRRLREFLTELRRLLERVAVARTQLAATSGDVGERAGRLYRFDDWPKFDVPAVAIRLYTVWRAEVLV
jgi:hypothetical protein